MLIGQLVVIDNEYYVYAGYISRSNRHEFIKVLEDNSKGLETKILSDISKVKLIELQPGDEVQICKHNTNFLNLYYVDAMRRHEGETTKILGEDIGGVLDNYKTYYLECTDSDFYWAANWFIPLKLMNTKNVDKENILLNKVYRSLGREL